VHRTTIMPANYGSDLRSLRLREERRLRVFDNKLLRRIFRPKLDKVTGVWRKLHNEELKEPYSLPNIILFVISRRWRGGEGASIGKRCIEGVVGKPQRKSLLGRRRHRWEV